MTKAFVEVHELRERESNAPLGAVRPPADLVAEKRVADAITKRGIFP